MFVAPVAPPAAQAPAQGVMVVVVAIFGCCVVMWQDGLVVVAIVVMWQDGVVMVAVVVCSLYSFLLSSPHLPCALIGLRWLSWAFDDPSFTCAGCCGHSLPLVGLCACVALSLVPCSSFGGGHSS